jgi:pyrroloquinoline quinone (PQQ) biosynthesis protein C
LSEKLDGWTDRQMNGWMSRCMGRWTDRSLDEWLERQKQERGRQAGSECHAKRWKFLSEAMGVVACS